MSRILYHMAHRSEWESSQSMGLYLGSPDDRRDGFIHFSTDTQVADSARRHRAGQADLLLIGVDETAVGPWKWEAARSGALFPHFYGALPVAAVASVQELPLGPDGLHLFPPLG